jgi:DNA polymerase-3 subunit epsilon
VRLIEDLLAADERFARDPAGNWGLAGSLAGPGDGSGWAAAPLEGVPFAVVDVETVGGPSEQRRILEMAVVTVRGGKLCEQYHSLVNPLRPVSQVVAELTGITQEMADGARPAAEVLAEVWSAIGDHVFVGHNVGSDLSFLNYEALWNDLPPFGNPALDTEELAMRVLPELRRPSLNRVASSFGLVPPLRHRALADARLTARVLGELLRRLPAAAGRPLRTLGELQDWLASPLAERQQRVRRVQTALPPGTLRDLPDAPGVYTFRDAAGQALYVGKAASLRERVAQHFSGTARALRHHDGLLERTAAVAHDVVGCELDALLLESAQIRALQPPYNVQTRSRRGCPYVHLEPGPFPRAGACRQALPTGGLAFAGPYRTTQQARHTVDVLRRVFQLRSCRRRLPATRAKLRIPCLRHGQGLCPAPCADLVTEERYGILVAYAWRFVTGGREVTLAALEAHLARLDGEGAGAGWERRLLQECHTRLRRVRRDYRPVEGGLAGGDVLMAYPVADGGAVLFFVREGRLRHRLRLPTEALNPDAVATLLAGLREGPDPAPDRALLDDDQTNILLRWIYRRAGHSECIPARPDDPPEALARDVLAALA